MQERVFKPVIPAALARRVKSKASEGAMFSGLQAAQPDVLCQFTLNGSFDD